MLWQIRAPRVVLAALVGGCLAVAGASYQGVFRNPLCDPYLLGVAGGAGLGATLAIVYATAAATGSNYTVPLAAFAGAILAVVVTYALGRARPWSHADDRRPHPRRSHDGDLHGGPCRSFWCSSSIRCAAARRTIYAWLLGGFSTATWHDVA